jgi:hypothetical protein
MGVAPLLNWDLIGLTSAAEIGRVRTHEAAMRCATIVRRTKP